MILDKYSEEYCVFKYEEAFDGVFEEKFFQDIIDKTEGEDKIQIAKYNKMWDSKFKYYNYTSILDNKDKIHQDALDGNPISQTLWARYLMSKLGGMENVEKLHTLFEAYMFLLISAAKGGLKANFYTLEPSGNLPAFRDVPNARSLGFRAEVLAFMALRNDVGYEEEEEGTEFGPTEISTIAEITRVDSDEVFGGASEY